MKKFIALLVCLVLVLSACAEKEPAPSDNSLSSNNSAAENSDANEETSSENDNAALDDWLENLEPMQVFKTEKEYPAVILEIFDSMMAQEEFEQSKSKELLSIDVSGDENAFYVHYLYVTNENIDGHLMIRVHKLESGEFALMARGGGPLAHGLEKTDLTLEDIEG